MSVYTVQIINGKMLTIGNVYPLTCVQQESHAVTRNPRIIYPTPFTDFRGASALLCRTIAKTLD